MITQIRPNRLEVSDRFPLLSFTVHNEGGPRTAEIVLAANPSLFSNPEERTASNFFSSRELGLLSLPSGQAVYTVPPAILARMAEAERLWFGLATADVATSSNWDVDVMPNEASPYISLSGLSNRAMGRVRMFPSRSRTNKTASAQPAPVRLEWAGDATQPGTSPATSPNSAQAPTAVPAAPAPNGAAAPNDTAPAADVPYDDGFGPLPAIDSEPVPATSANNDIASNPVSAMGRGGNAQQDPITTMLPDGGLGFTTYNKEYENGTKNDQSGTAAFIQALIDLAGEWSNESIRLISFGDISHPGGTSFQPDHQGHVNGNEVDIRPFRTDGKDKPTSVTDSVYDSILTRKLVEFIHAKHPTAVIYFNDAAMVRDGLTHSVPGHHNHLHLILPGMGATPAQSQSLAAAIDPEQRGIEGPAMGPAAPATARALALTNKEYDGVSRTVPSPNFTTGRSGHAIDRIVIHITDAPTTSSTVNWFSNPDAEVSAHYLVGQDGEIVQLVSEDDTAWHARGSNSRSIGIEHVAVKRGGATYGSTHYPEMHPTDIQYSESSALVVHLCDKYGLTPDRTTIIGHNEADSRTTHSTCPTGSWDWDHFMDLVTNRMSIPRPVPASGGAQALGREIPIDPGVGGMSIGMDSLEVGDIIVSTTTQAVSAAIRAVSDAEVSHAMLYVGQGGQVIEAIGDGVVMRPLSEALAESNLAVAFRVPGLTATQGQQVAEAAVQHLGLPYNYGGIVRYGKFRMESQVCNLLSGEAGDLCRGFYGWLYLGPETNDTFFCSQLVLQAFEQAGHRITTMNALAATPGDIVDMQMEDGSLNYVGHLKSEEPQHSFFGISLSAGAAQAGALGKTDYTINWDDVQLIPQPTGNSCWATAAAMLVGWRDHVSISPATVAELDGLTTGQGLFPHEKQSFANAVGLVVEPNATFTPEGFRELLEQNGPIWVTAKDPAIHAIVVTGMYSTNGQTYVRITDPWDRPVGTPGSPGPVGSTYNTGSRYIETYENFVARFQAVGNVERIQLLHTGGTHGNTLNRGEASPPPGYAQGSQPAHALGRESYTVNWDDVQQIAQPTGKSCWSTAAAMIIGWRDQQSITPAYIAEVAGKNISEGLFPSEHEVFAASHNLEMLYNQSYTPEGFRDMLEANGPIFVINSDAASGIHAIVVTGMYGDGGQHYVRVTDPWDRVVGSPGAPGPYGSGHTTGSRYIMTWEDFTAEYEKTAAHPRTQIMHTGGTHGQTLNRGEQSPPPGYAQAANAAAPVLSSPTAQGEIVADNPFGPSTVLSRQRIDKNGRSYDLAQLKGLVMPSSPLMGGDGVPVAGERIMLDDWPYIDGPTGKTQAGVAIDWGHSSGAVGEVAITPLDGQTLDGWSVAVKADLLPNGSTPEVAHIKVQVATTFTKDGEEPQTAVSEVTLGGDGRTQIRHGADQAPLDVPPEISAEPMPAPTPAPAQPMPVMPGDNSTPQPMPISPGNGAATPQPALESA